MRAEAATTTFALCRRAAPVRPARLFPAIGAGAASVGCGIGLLATSGWLITRASTRPAVFVLSIAIGLVQAFALGRGAFRYLQRLAVHDLSLDVLGRLRVHLFDVLEPRLPGRAGRNLEGDALSALVADADLVAEGFARQVTAVVDVGASIVLGAALSGVVDPAVGAVLGAGALLVVAVAWMGARAGRAAAEEESAVRAELAGVVVEAVRAAPELTAFGRGDLVEARLGDVQRRSAVAARRRGVRAGVGRGAVALTGGAVVAAALAAGLGAHDGHRLSGVMLAVVAFVALAVVDQCTALVVALSDNGDGAARRLGTLAGLAPPVPEPIADRSDEVRAGDARLEDVDVGTGEDGVLRRVSLRAGPGSTVAVVGPSGSGKTSILHTLLHFVEPDRGRASIGGVDVRHMTRAGIARHVAFMGEDTHLFAASLGENLRVARPDATEGQCRHALAAVGLGPWLATLAEGLDTVLGAGGRPVSAGERQRLGLARAILAGGSVLLLDEPTAHVDPVGAPALLGDLLAAAGDRTVVMAGHGAESCGPVDAVVTVDHGRVMDAGRSLVSRPARTDVCPGPRQANQERQAR